MKRKLLLLSAILLSGCAHTQYVSDKELLKEVQELKENHTPKRNSLYDLEVRVSVDKMPAGEVIKGLCQSYQIPCVLSGVKEERKEVSIKNFNGKLGDLLSIIYEQTGLDYGIEKGVLILRDYKRDDEIRLKGSCEKPINVAFKNAPLSEVLLFFNREYGYTFSFSDVGGVQTAQIPPQMPQQNPSDLIRIQPLSPQGGGERVSLFYNGCDIGEAIQILAKQLDVVIKPIGEKAFLIDRYDRVIIDKSTFFDYNASLSQSGSSAGSSGTSAPQAGSTSTPTTTTTTTTSTGGASGGSSVSISENHTSKVEEFLRAFLSPEGRVKFSPRGYVVVEDRPSRIALIREVLRKEKKKEEAIRVRVQIFRLDLSDEYQAGVDWNVLIGSMIGNWQNLRITTNFASGINGVAIQGDYRGATNFLRLLQQYGKIRLVKEFQSVGRAGLPVVFTAIDRIPYVSTTVQTGSTGGATAFPQINYEEAGIKIILYPNVQRDLVDLNTAIEVSEYKGDKAYNLGEALGIISVPLISKNTISIPARVPFGETLIITGFHVSKRGITGQGLPEISKLPIIGELFGYKDSQVQNSELIFVITPERVE